LPERGARGGSDLSSASTPRCRIDRRDFTAGSWLLDAEVDLRGLPTDLPDPTVDLPDSKGDLPESEVDFPVSEGDPLDSEGDFPDPEGDPP